MERATRSGDAEELNGGKISGWTVVSTLISMIALVAGWAWFSAGRGGFGTSRVGVQRAAVVQAGVSGAVGVLIPATPSAYSSATSEVPEVYLVASAEQEAVIQRRVVSFGATLPADSRFVVVTSREDVSQAVQEVRSENDVLRPAGFPPIEVIDLRGL